MIRRRSQTARIRFGNYEFQKIGVSRFHLSDPYHLAVTLTWPQFLGALLTLYLSVNIIFAALFWLVRGSVGNARPDSFADAFFFSVETLATVGYGDMHPATVYGHAVATVEIICGLAFTAILTGLTFVRFSRPRAKLVFAQHPVIATRYGKPTLMLRIGNARATVLTDATARLSVVLSETGADGAVFYRASELQLERAHLPIFPMFWTLMHVLDEGSPLRDLDAARAIEAHTQVFVMLEARDPTLGTMVHDIRNYDSRDLRFGERYVDIVTAGANGMPIMDLTRIGAVERDRGDRPEQGWTEREMQLSQPASR